jgi:hypothetical protein
MALDYIYDATLQYKQNVYNIYLDLSGWDKTTITVVAPQTGSLGVIGIYGTSDPGSRLGFTDGNAQLATNYSPIQATNLATGTAVTTISATGNYKVDANARFLKLYGGADVYRLFFNHQKGS